MQGPRDQFWDAFKGIGILAIVLAHSGFPHFRFLYLFHIALFFFVSGIFMNSSMPFGMFIRKRMRTLVAPYIGINILYFLIERMGREEPWNITAKRVLKIFLLDSDIRLLGPLWFIPFLFFNVFCGYFLCRYAARSRKRMMGIFAFLMILAEIIHRCQWHFYYRLEFLPLTLAVVFLGCAYKDDVFFLRTRVLGTGYAGFVGLAVLIGVCWTTRITIDLANRQVYEPFIYIVMSACGVALTCAASGISMRAGLVKGILPFLGRSSYFIMAFHCCPKRS